MYIGKVLKTFKDGNIADKYMLYIYKDFVIDRNGGVYSLKKIEAVVDIIEYPFYKESGDFYRTKWFMNFVGKLGCYILDKKRGRVFYEEHISDMDFMHYQNGELEYGNRNNV